MADKRAVFRLISTSDAEIILRTRQLVDRSLKLLECPMPDTFLGRKTQESFPTEVSRAAFPSRNLAQRRACFPGDAAITAEPEKQSEVKKPQLSPLEEETRRVIEEYAESLRESAKQLRRKLH
ncbi:MULTISPECIES: hypothetical protein [Bradyrhizobium]|uniref:hypothetical protein n=1 Tax=Bradyrhizobium TaxID=374 RepID=UPI00155E7F9B|nr:MULTISPECIES: hypothetical protein [Bradyrhizobium]MDD1519989.1 hypothetical protein [Bradyrhizobium sp. WBAH30]MDD1544233.1 hypothetical protein [Bradyrhizobium sp. WBAH41]MDD1558115.1 hypothetical protein [Bradyrhizobium sp. WBAH23]MDD1565513.1 hypothetical protein [Bradyrhizobium sp. WBAH33]MDD1590643.1 hypothetical protein [Bradyrhizobium sp. WBAH42]